MSLLTKDSTEYIIFLNVWKMFHKYYDSLSADRSDVVWSDLIEDSLQLEKQYPGNVLCQNLIIATVKTLEYQFDRKRGEND